MSGEAAIGAADGGPFTLLGWPDYSLFVDFDGTLVELAARPEQVLVTAQLVATLARLQELLGGRLAVVSGRPIAQIDTMLFPLLLPVAGVHGLERRGADGIVRQAPIPDMSPVLAAAQLLAASHPGLWVEQKYGALAVHYRQAPALGRLVDAVMLDAVGNCPGTILLKGKMVTEIKPAGIDKGTAVRDFLNELPFAGHLAIFAGDDVTDEAGFAMVQQAGGAGIKVGPGPSIAEYRIDSPAALYTALDQVVHTLSRRNG
ncbi:MAG: otsB [Massilia sp.]|nr:otsB [Massilia sp.]